MTSRHQDARRDERDNAGSLDPPIPMLVSDVGVIPFERFSLNVIAVLDRQRNTSRHPAELSDNCSAEFRNANTCVRLGEARHVAQDMLMPAIAITFRR